LNLKKLERLVYTIAHEDIQFTERGKNLLLRKLRFFFLMVEENFVINVNLINSGSCFRVLMDFRILSYTR